MSYQMRAHQACVINTSPVLPGSPQAQQPGLPEDPRWALCSVLCALAYANDSLALATHLTYFQSRRPIASGNESITSVNDSWTLVSQLPRYQTPARSHQRYSPLNLFRINHHPARPSPGGSSKPRSRQCTSCGGSVLACKIRRAPAPEKEDAPDLRRLLFSPEAVFGGSFRSSACPRPVAPEVKIWPPLRSIHASAAPPPILLPSTTRCTSTADSSLRLPARIFLSSTPPPAT